MFYFPFLAKSFFIASLWKRMEKEEFAESLQRLTSTTRAELFTSNITRNAREQSIGLKAYFYSVSPRRQCHTHMIFWWLILWSWQLRVDILMKITNIHGPALSILWTWINNYGLNVCVPLECIYISPIPQCDYLWTLVLWEVIQFSWGHKGAATGCGLVPF